MTTETPKKEEKAIAKANKFQELVGSTDTQEMFRRMLGKDADGFMQNMLTVYNAGLQGCDPDSVVAACAISASLGLSILPGLGQSCVVPYKDGDRIVAQWQIMTRGVIQLAHRSGQYERVNAARVYEGQLVSHDEHKGTVTLRAERKSDKVEGYYFWFKLNTGLSMEFYWSAKKCIEHGLRFSKSFQAGGGKWTEDPEFVAAGGVKKWLAAKGPHLLTEGSGADAMSAKTSVKNPLLKWGPLDTKVKEKVNLDQAVFGADGKPNYIDVPPGDVDSSGGGKTYTAPPMAPAGAKPPALERIVYARDAAAKHGVTSDQFNAWLEKVPGDDEAKADAATEAWKRAARKECSMAEAFAVPAEKEGATAKGAAEAVKEASFQVYGVATADVDGNPDCFVIRDTSEPAVKYFTDSAEISEHAKKFKTGKGKMAVKFVEKGEGKSAYRWITALA